ncbi:MAG: DoxX family protein [Gemmatimonadaceae bacterium]
MTTVDGRFAASLGESKGRLWTGRILSGLSAAFMLFDAVIHIMKPAVVVTAFEQLGFPISASATIAIIELICVILYLIPRTSVLGAILLTGYLGGAIAVQVRIGAPLFSTTLFPIYVALFLWGGLYLRDQRVRALVPLRT